LHILFGKPLLLTLRGETLKPNLGCLVPQSKHFKLNPVPLGQVIPVRQPLMFKNPCNGRVHFKVIKNEIKSILMVHEKKVTEDGEFIDSIKDGSEFKLAVLDILENQGSILGNQTGFMTAVFRPIEAKVYGITVPIQVVDINGNIQNLTIDVSGIGYHPDQIKDDEIIFKPSEKK